MEMQAVREEHEQVTKLISEYRGILKDEKKILGMIKSEALAVKEKYGDERRTRIEANAMDMDIEDLIPVENVLIMTSQTGYVKRISLDTYESQNRGGVGLIGMETKEEDYIVDMFVTCSHDYVMYFTNKGRAYWLKAYKIPVGGRHAKGKPIVNLLEHLEEGEKVMSKIPVKQFEEGRYLVFSTKRGLIKKTRLDAYSHVRQSGIIAIRLEEGDELVDTALTDGTKEVVLATRKGLAARFGETDVRPTGRATYGVRGIRLVKGDEVVSMAIVDPKDVLLSVTEKGYGKRSLVDDYRRIRRGGKGVITIKTVERNGDVVDVLPVAEDDEILVTSVKGMVIRMPVKGISLMGRATMGVRLMKLKERDRAVALARLVPQAEEARMVESGMVVTHAPQENGAEGEDGRNGDDNGDGKGGPDEEEE
jgi:DNA gyrase subunit A